MISDKKKNLNNTIYGRANLPSRLDMATKTTTYIYDANDMRIYKKVDSVDVVFKEEYYLRDATGRELAVIDNNYNINWYIYGKERVASMQHEMPVGLEKLFITGNISDGTHYAADKLSTDGNVQSDATLEAGDRVSMLPGFTAPADAEFKADIKKPDGIPKFIYYLYDHLGNTRVTYHVDLYVDVGVDAVQVEYTVQSATDYYPYGKALRSFGKERYQSTYHEKDVESDFDYRGARFYDADVARFNSLDPLSAKFPEWSDYNYVLGNPIIFTDPTGRNPVFDMDGNFLGTDELGIQGDAIIMNAESFMQGMSQEEALSAGSLMENMSLNSEVEELIQNQLAGFPDRPDWDGWVTDEEARDWWENGNGTPLYVNYAAFQERLNNVSTLTFNNEEGVEPINFFFRNGSDDDMSNVYGTIRIQLLNIETGEVALGNTRRNFIDRYDFERQDGRPLRNIATWWARNVVLNDGLPFNIMGYGQNPTIRQSQLPIQNGNDSEVQIIELGGGRP